MLFSYLADLSDQVSIDVSPCFLTLVEELRMLFSNRFD